MSERAEKALENYSIIEYSLKEVAICKKGFLDGYEQAEKDLVLTVDDIILINQLLKSEITFVSTHPRVAFKQVLDRFNQLKKEKNEM